MLFQMILFPSCASGMAMISVFFSPRNVHQNIVWVQFDMYKHWQSWAVCGGRALWSRGGIVDFFKREGFEPQEIDFFIGVKGSDIAGGGVETKTDPRRRWSKGEEFLLFMEVCQRDFDEWTQKVGDGEPEFEPGAISE